MEKDDQELLAAATPEAGVRAPGRGITLKLLMLASTLVALAVATGLLMAPLLRPKSASALDEANAATQTPPMGPALFGNWPKPEVALLLSGEQHGFLQPCGCSEPQKGGLARRYEFLQTLVQRNWTVVAADVGDIAQESGPQARLKFEYSMKALEKLGYTAICIGKNEVTLPLGDGLADTVLNNKDEPRALLANLANREKDYPEMIESWVVSKAGAPKVGFVGIVGPSLANKLGKSLQFVAEDRVLPDALKALQQEKAEVLVLLYQGDVHEATKCAQKFPQFHVIVHTAQESEPSAQPVPVGNTLLVNTGHKGKFVGVVGVFQTGNAAQPFSLKYQLVDLDPRYETPAGQEKNNPVHGVIQEYAQAVKDRNLLQQFLLNEAHALQIEFPQAEYEGSDRCKDCHKSAYAVWKNHRHSRAYDTLVKAKRPTLREFDGECLVCHVTGLGYKTGFTGAAASPHLLNVGCENCHGPGSLHVAQPNNLKLRAAMNPFKARPGEAPSKLEDRIFQACFKCHDPENDVHFDSKTFPEYFKKTYHTTDKKAAQQQNAPPEK